MRSAMHHVGTAAPGFQPPGQSLQGALSPKKCGSLNLKGGSRVNRISGLAVFLGAVLVLTCALPARADLRYDGSLPIYPNAIVAGEAGAPADKFAKALKQGFQIFADTSDSPATVVSWYRAHLPASFTMHTESAGTQFKGGSSVVNVVTYHGKTRIMLSP